MVTKAQQLMIEDGAPMCCFLTTEERAENWRRNPPKPWPQMATQQRYATPEVAAAAEIVKQTKTRKRIDRMMSNMEGKTWDAMKARWVDDTQPAKPNRVRERYEEATAGTVIVQKQEKHVPKGRAKKPNKTGPKSNVASRRRRKNVVRRAVTRRKKLKGKVA